MIDPLTISTILGGGKTLFGLGQMLFNDKPDRPTYEIPSELSQIVGLSRSLVSQNGLPAQDLINRNLASTTAQNVNSIQETTTGGAGLGAVAQAYGNQLGAQQNLAVQGANYQSQQVQGLQRALGMMANAKNTEFEYNKNMPYQRDLQSYYQNQQAGAQNLFGGMMDITSALGMKQQDGQFNSMMDTLFGGGEKKAESYSPDQQQIIKNMLTMIGNGTQFS